MSKEWITVCKEDDLVPGSGVCVLHNKNQVALFRESESSPVYAVSNYDPFGEANVLSRAIIGSSGDKLVIASPLFKQHFCLATGKCIEDETVSIKTYKVRIDSSQVQLQN
jgi:nitrite reductase (NADH) small subunit